MNNRKCPDCGLVNFSTAPECKRCGTLLSSDAETVAEAYAGPGHADGFAEWEEEKPPRSLKRRVFVGLSLAALLIFVWYISLLESSTAATYEERQQVRRAIDIIERKGFTKDAFLLRRLASFRTSDNWWNRRVGHADAYAATNFPFEIVTLYPEFFSQPKDDTERALILVHEARHLAGAGEEEAFRSVWQDRERLGYINEAYMGTPVWLNVAEHTFKYAPEIVVCGPNEQKGCPQANSLSGQ